MPGSSSLNKKECYFCKTQKHLESHHIFQGLNRQNSERYGLKVWLCREHHTGINGVHHNAVMKMYLKKMAQSKFEEEHSREEFMEIFGRNYL